MKDVEFRKAIETVLSDPFFTTSQYKDTLRLLLAATHVGTSDDALARFTGLNRDNFVRPRVKRLRSSGVWGRGVVHCSWGSPEGCLALLCDALVAEGVALRKAK